MYDRESLESMTVDELQELAAGHDIAGRSGMNKAALVDALLEIPPEPVADPSTDDQRIANLEARVSTLEARLQAVDDRTRPSTQILGSSDIGGDPDERRRKGWSGTDR